MRCAHPALLDGSLSGLLWAAGGIAAALATGGFHQQTSLDALAGATVFGLLAGVLRRARRGRLRRGSYDARTYVAPSEPQQGQSARMARAYTPTCSMRASPGLAKLVVR